MQQQEVNTLSLYFEGEPYVVGAFKGDPHIVEELPPRYALSCVLTPDFIPAIESLFENGTRMQWAIGSIFGEFRLEKLREENGIWQIELVIADWMPPMSDNALRSVPKVTCAHAFNKKYKK
jgi:hypothetical protein